MCFLKYSDVGNLCVIEGKMYPKLEPEVFLLHMVE